MRRALALLLLPAIAFADHLTVTADRTTGQGVASHFVVVERFDDAGVPLAGPTLPVRVSSSSASAEFHSAPWFASGWQDGGVYTLFIGTGATQARFSYRDRQQGAHVLTASATGLSPAVGTITVDSTLVADGFEGSVLMGDDPPGEWPWIQITPGNPLVFAREAAHAGDAGLRQIDGESDPTMTGGSAYVGFFGSDVTAPIHFRGWLRRRSTVAGPTHVLTLHGPAGPFLALEVDSSGLLGVSGNSSAGYSYDASTAIIEDDRWYLVNARVAGLGTDAGTRAVFVSGFEPLEVPVELSGFALRSAFLGNTWGAPKTFSGEIHWDDVRMSTEPLGDTLRADLPPTAPPGACIPATLHLYSTLARVDATAPYDVDVRVEPPVHRVADCSDAPVSTVRLAKQQTSASVWLLGADAGTLRLSMSNPDFLPGEASVVLRAEPLPRRELAAGCACSSAPAGFVIVLLALRRRRTGAAHAALG